MAAVFSSPAAECSQVAAAALIIFIAVVNISEAQLE
jgi:hypothetical protein